MDGEGARGWQAVVLGVRWGPAGQGFWGRPRTSEEQHYGNVESRRKT